MFWKRGHDMRMYMISLKIRLYYATVTLLLVLRLLVPWNHVSVSLPMQAFLK